MKLLSYFLLTALCSYASFSFAQNKEQLAIGTVVKMTFEGKLVEAELVGRATLNQEQEDENINKSLLEPDKESLVLAINFVMVDNPITNDIFIFALEADEAETLTLEMFEEEGFSKVLNCTFNVEAGLSYKVVDLGTVDNGNYTFRLQNKQEAELIRIITIEKS